jgi:hypothetical protein
MAAAQVDGGVLEFAEAIFLWVRDDVLRCQPELSFALGAHCVASLATRGRWHCFAINDSLPHR